MASVVTSQSHIKIPIPEGKQEIKGPTHVVIENLPSLQKSESDPVRSLKPSLKNSRLSGSQDSSDPKRILFGDESTSEANTIQAEVPETPTDSQSKPGQEGEATNSIANEETGSEGKKQLEENDQFSDSSSDEESDANTEVPSNDKLEGTKEESISEEDTNVKQDSMNNEHTIELSNTPKDGNTLPTNVT